MRDQFEKLPEIKEMLLNNDELKWCYETNRYINHRVFQDAETGYINGALYAFQQQQTQYNELESLYHQQGLNMLEMRKKIDSAIRLLDEKSLYHKTSGDRFVFSEDIRGLLK